MRSRCGLPVWVAMPVTRTYQPPCTITPTVLNAVSEISELLDIPVGTVKSRMHNAIAALKQMLGSASDAGAADQEVGKQEAGKQEVGKLGAGGASTAPKGIVG